MLFYIPQATPVMTSARRELLRLGCPVTETPGSSVTHVLLNVPTSMPEEELSQILNSTSKDAIVMGGNLKIHTHQSIDLLQDARYLADNASITAHGALKVLLSHLPITLQGCPVLIIGWGRIGKCLAKLLKDLGAKITVAARKEEDRAILETLGYTSADTARLEPTLGYYRVIFNTAPSPVISQEQAELCRADCVKIDLASKPGIAGEDVIWARGLPGKETPEASGKLIARTALRLTQERSRL